MMRSDKSHSHLKLSWSSLLGIKCDQAIAHFSPFWRNIPLGNEATFQLHSIKNYYKAVFFLLQQILSVRNKIFVCDTNVVHKI